MTGKMVMTKIDAPVPPPARPVVIVAEDDPAVRRSLQLLLHGKGYDVRSHGSATSLLGDPATRGAVCLIADYRMAGLNGVELLHGLRATGWNGAAVLITAFLSHGICIEARQAGFGEILEKPFRDRSLIDTVLRLTGADTIPAVSRLH